MRIPNVGTTVDTMTASTVHRKPDARVLIRPIHVGGGCKRALEKTVFSKGRLQPLARRALGSSCVQGALPRAVVWFGSPGGTDRGREACHWLTGGGASCLLVHPGALGQEAENFRPETGEEPSGPGQRLQGPLSGRKPRPQGPHNYDSPGTQATDSMTIDRSPLLGGPRQVSRRMDWSSRTPPVHLPAGAGNNR